MIPPLHFSSGPALGAPVYGAPLDQRGPVIVTGSATRGLVLVALALGVVLWLRR